MVGVKMGQQHQVNLLRLVAGGLQVLYELAQRGPAPVAARTGIDENELGAGVDEVALDGSRDILGIVLEGARQEGLDECWIEARNLLMLHRRFSLGRCD